MASQSGFCVLRQNEIRAHLPYRNNKFLKRITMTEQVTEYIKESTGRTWKEPEETRII